MEIATNWTSRSTLNPFYPATDLYPEDVVHVEYELYAVGITESDLKMDKAHDEKCEAPVSDHCGEFSLVL